MIVVLGSCNADFNFTVDRLPTTGETISSRDFAIYAGGKGANQSLAARRAGGDVAFFGAVGKDTDADIALASLMEAGVNLDSVRRSDVETGRAHIFVDSKGDNFIVLTAGANHALDVADAEAAVAAAEGGILLLQQEIPDKVTEAALKAAQSRDVRTILNVSPFITSSPRLAMLADIVLTNETEWEGLAAAANVDPAKPQDWTVERGQTLVVTKGGDGAFLYSPQENCHVAAPKITPVDTVGAGDTFTGYFAAALAEKKSLREALALGVKAASLACLKPGAQPSIPLRTDVLRLSAKPGKKPCPARP